MNVIWYSEVENTIAFLQIEIDPANALKSEWKKVVKEKIMLKILDETRKKAAEMRKLRFIDGFGRKNFIDELNGDQVIEYIKIKLNMVTYLSGNFGKKEICKICTLGEETTEHVFECSGIQNNDKLTADDLLTTDKDNILRVLRLFRDYKSMREAADSEQPTTDASTPTNTTNDPCKEANEMQSKDWV